MESSPFLPLPEGMIIGQWKAPRFCPYLKG